MVGAALSLECIARMNALLQKYHLYLMSIVIHLDSRFRGNDIFSYVLSSWPVILTKHNLDSDRKVGIHICYSTGVYMISN